MKKEVKKWTIGRLVELMVSSKICLPDFQREFVWSPKQMAKLVESVIRQYPVGTILLLGARQNPDLGRRSFLGPDVPVYNPEYFVIDGQQRLMTFLLLLRSPQVFEPTKPVEWRDKKYKIFYKIDAKLGNLPTEVDRPSFVVPHWVEPDETDDYEWQREDRIIPVEFLLSRRLISRWVKVALARHKRHNRAHIVRHLTAVGQRLKSYECPVEMLEGHLKPLDHANMFRLLNEAGTDLTTFDLMVARLAPSGIKLRQLWKEARKANPMLDEYDIDPEYILKVVSLIVQTKAGKERPTCRRADLEQIPQYFEKGQGSARRQFEEAWRLAAKYVDKACSTFKTEFGVCQRKYVPYTPMIVTLAAAHWWTQHERAYDNRFQSRILRRLAQWYWGSVMKLAYGSGTDRVVSEHFRALRVWLAPAGGKKPSAIELPGSKSEVRESVRSIESSGDARYKAILCLPMMQHARDIYNHEYLPDSKQGQLQDHHIYPAALLEKQGVERHERNYVVNRMLITGKTNQQIKDKAPSQYLRECRSKELRRHLLFTEIFTEEMSFGEFIRRRESLIVDRLWRLLRGATLV